MVSDWTPGPASSEIQPFGRAELTGGITYSVLLGAAPRQSVQLVTDGTAQGTYALDGTQPDQDPRLVTEAFFDGSRIWLQGLHKDQREYVWVADRKAGSCRLLENVLGRPMNGTDFFRYGSRVAFRGSDPATGWELWVSDATQSGTVPLFELVPGPGSLQLRCAAAAAGGLLVGVDDTKRHALLWSDGTLAGLRLLAHVQVHDTGGRLLRPAWFHALSGGRWLFAGEDESSGLEPWVTDGSPQGTQQLANVAQPSDTNSLPGGGVALGGTFFFPANDGVSGEELWSTDANRTSTKLFADLRPGALGSAPGALVAGPSRIHFVANDGKSGAELWTSDGTSSGTRLVADLTPGNDRTALHLLGSLGSQFYFLARLPNASHFALHVEDGNTLRKVPLGPHPSSWTPGFFTAHAGRAWFGQEPGGGFRPLAMLEQNQWTLLTDANGSPQLALRVRGLGPHVYFVGVDLPGPTNVWRSDGTRAGTTLYMASSELLDVVRGRVLIRHRPQGFPGPVELWASDGGAAQPVRVFRTNDQIVRATHFGSTFVIETDDGHGNQKQLWITDGTSAGTFQPPATPDFAKWVQVLGERHALFVASTTTHGNELWITDGTAAGTKLFVDAAPGAGSSDPLFLGGFRGRAVVSVQDPIRGREAFVASQGAGQHPGGPGCGRSGSELRSSDPVLGSTMRVEGGFAPLSSVGVLLLGGIERHPAALVPGDCYLQVDLAQLYLLHAFAVPKASWQLGLPLPNVPALVGAEFGMQCVYLVSSGPMEATAGLHARMGF